MGSLGWRPDADAGHAIHGRYHRVGTRRPVAGPQRMGLGHPAKEFMEKKYDPAKVCHINIGQGATERLVSLLGGYTESMVALAVEPEAVRDFFEAYADFQIKFFDNLYERYPINMVTYHDDWGTERDTFFSEKMFEELVYEPTKRIVEHIRSKDIVFQLHSCGKIERFIPYIIDMGIDFIQIQSRANDVKMYKEKFGDKLGLNSYGIIGIVPGSNMAKEDYIAAIRKDVENYGSHGGYYTSISPEPDLERTWDGIWEMYCYSREFYDKERGDK